MKIAMIGGRTSTVGFKPLGIDTYPVREPERALEVWEGIDLSKYGIIFMTEPIYERLKQKVDEIRSEFLPAVIVIPAVVGSRGIASAEIRALVEKAVGTDMMIGE